MKKILSFLYTYLLLIPCAGAQMFEGVPLSVTAVNSESAEKVSAESAVVENSATQAEEEPEDLGVPLMAPFEVTAEQKTAIRKPVRQKVSAMIRQNNKAERQAMLDILVTGERQKAKMQALREGKSLEEAQKAADAVQKPDVDVSDEDAVVEYLYKQSGLK